MTKVELRPQLQKLLATYLKKHKQAGKQFADFYRHAPNYKDSQRIPPFFGNECDGTNGSLPFLLYSFHYAKILQARGLMRFMQRWC